MKIRLLAIALMLLTAVSTSTKASGADFFDKGPATRFIDIDAHLLLGASAVMQNYNTIYPEISDLSVNPGFAAGVGSRVILGIRNWLGVGAELNFMLNNSSLSALIAGNGDTPLSAMYLRNHYYTLNVPMFASLRFNVSSDVRWCIDVGAYYTLGLGGTQKQNIYASYVNVLGQLINITQHRSTGYYNDPQAFLNSSWRSDWGLHLGTSIDFARHVSVGFGAQIGIKDEANTTNAGTPGLNVRNLSLTARLGYRF